MRWLTHHLSTGLIVAALGLNNSTSPAFAVTIQYNFDAVLFSGPLAVTYFDGKLSYDDTNVTSKGDEFAPLTSLKFTVGNVPVTEMYCTQGCQVELLNGKPYTFTAYLPIFEFPTCPRMPMSPRLCSALAGRGASPTLRRTAVWNQRPPAQVSS
jgi:hypothetical protein